MSNPNQPVVITGGRVNITCPGRNFVTLIIETDQGVIGLGDATLNGREMAVVSQLTDHLIPCLIGMDAQRIEDVWWYLYNAEYWDHGDVSMSALSAVDMALWDIKGKITGMPVYQLLGGACSDGVMVYGHANGADVPALLDEFARYRDLGYKAIRVQCGIPGLSDAYGVGKGKDYYEPADGHERPKTEYWDTDKYLNFVPKMLDAVRAKFGFEDKILHDVHHRLTPIEGARLGKSIEEYGLFWLEDVLQFDTPDGYRLLRQHTTVPLAVGECFTDPLKPLPLIEQQLIDYLRMTAVHGGGISGLRRLANSGIMRNVRTGCHGATDLSPVCMAAQLHLGLATINFGIQEYMRHTKETDEVFPHAYNFKEGYMHPGDSPGLGVDLDEKAASKYEYRRAYLPVARRQSGGTVVHW